MSKRTFTPDEINQLLNSLAGDDPYDLGNGLTATRMVSTAKVSFKIERDGKGEHFLKDADAAELAEISAALWERGKEFLPDDAAPDKTPRGWEEKDSRFVCKDTACGRLCTRKDLCPENCDLLARNLATAAEKKRLDDLTPENLRDVPDRDDLEPDPLGLTPDSLREKKDPFEGTIEALTPNCLRDIIRDPGLARRLALGTATAQEKLDDLLTPPGLMDKAE